jgi:RHS repeat-associated protein
MHRNLTQVSLHFPVAALVLLVSLETNAAVGRTAGESTVSASGEATYVIPITVPGGINGLTPEMALAYGHRRAEGIAGVGWGISGLSEITRCAKTEAQDGESKTVELSTADRICMDGVQLRLTSGTYGFAGSKYRSEVDTIARYTANGTAGNGPAWFKVEDKNGLIYEYGNSTDSRIESLASGWTTTAITWAMNRIVDRQGNEIVFSYTEDGAPYGGHRINSVKYRSNPGQGVSSGYSIDFGYQTQLAADVDAPYAAGGLVQDIKRLETVDVSYTTPSNVLVRRYTLSYETSLSTANRSRVTSIQECAGAPLECLPATTFTYQNGTNDFDAEVSSGSTVPAGARVLPIDINGDGRTDLVYSSSAGAGTWYYRLANASGTYDIPQNSGISNTNHAKAIVIDYDSDGLDDILVPYSGSTWWVIHGSTSGLQSPINTLAPAVSTVGNATALDMDGDGRDDLVWGQNVGSSSGSVVYVRYRLSTGDGFSSTAYTLYAGSGTNQLAGPTLFSGAYTQNRNQHFDANGDGMRDLALVTLRTFGPPLEPIFRYFTDIVLGGNAGVFSVKANTTVGLPIDVNGDGYTDIAYRLYSGPLLFRLSTGKSFGGAVTGQSLSGFNFNLAVATDWNGDGMQDLLIPNTSTGTWYYLLSAGDSFAAGVDTQISTSGAISTFHTDHNGDGLDDIGFVRSDYVYAHLPHSGVTPDLMQTAADGNGNSITFNYTSIAQSSYTKYANATFPYQDYVGPLQVVKSAVPSTGVGTGTYTLTYTYAGAQLNLEGRGLSTFDKKTTEDSRNGITVTEFFHTEFPNRGRSYQRELRQSDGTPIQIVTRTWASKPGGSGYQNYLYPYISYSVEKNYEAGGAFNGAQINEATTTIVADSYGTPTSITKVTTEKSTANGAQPGASFTQQVLNTSITNNTTSWCLGRPGQTQWVNSHNQTYGAQITRTVTRSWETSTYCRLTQEITEPASSTFKVTRSLGYDSFGNVNSETVTGNGMAARTTTSYWGTTGQLLLSVTNALGQTSTLSWNLTHGVKASQTDPNGLAAYWLYDVFGRNTREIRPDGTYSDFSLTDCTSANSYCGTAYDQVKTKVSTLSKTTTGATIRSDDAYLDKADRPVQLESQTMGAAMSRVRTIYDSLGRVAQRSVPSFSSTPAYYATASYDLLNRPTQISRPIDAGNATLQSTNVSYEGLTTTTTDAEGKKTRKITDAAGRVFRSIDDAGYYQQFDIDAFGSMLGVTDSLGNNLLQATYAYGIRSHRLTSDDMDLGAWTYSPNALGEIVSYTDAKGQGFSATFDQLSRPLTRTEPGNNTTWTWGASAAAHNIGRLASIATSGHSESYTFDSVGRLSQRTTIADTSYQTNYAYDSSTGLLGSLTYPVSTSGYRLKLKYDYGYGILNKVSDFNGTTVYWQGTSVDARGNVIQDTLGNGLQTVRGFDTVTGLPDYIQSGPGGGSARQNLALTWNKVGSLSERLDLNRSLSENFYYDNLHRLDYSELNGVQNLDLSYDAMGNISFKDDVGPNTWSYDSVRKHAVSNASGITFQYDDNGNQIMRGSDAIVWTSYNYPSRINNGSKSHDFYYGGDRQRWKQVYDNGSSIETTIFVGGILEKRMEGTYTEYRHTIKVGSTAVALYTRPSSGSITTKYFLLDHLGSVAEITDSAGGIDVSESFGAYGQRRDPTTWDDPISAVDETAIGDITQRGYTFHTNLESSSLIHMNGRVMDGLTGRFLSPDPYVPNPGNSQSFNRYSYVRNNPLTFTDPSGFVPCLDGISTKICQAAASYVISAIFGKLFGGGHGHPPPKGCFVQGTGCYGKASSSKLFDMVTDILDGPLKSYGRNDESIWAGCRYCLSAAEVVADSQTDSSKGSGSTVLGSILQGILGISNASADELPGGPVFVFDDLVITPEDLVFSASDSKALFEFDYGPLGSALDPDKLGFEQRAFAQGLFIRQAQVSKSTSILSSLFGLRPPSPAAIIKALGKSSAKAALAEGKLNRASLSVAVKHKEQFLEEVYSVAQFSTEQ